MSNSIYLYLCKVINVLCIHIKSGGSNNFITQLFNLAELKWHIWVLRCTLCVNTFTPDHFGASLPAPVGHFTAIHTTVYF